MNTRSFLASGFVVSLLAAVFFAGLFFTVMPLQVFAVCTDSFGMIVADGTPGAFCSGPSGNQLQGQGGGSNQISGQGAGNQIQGQGGGGNQIQGQGGSQSGGSRTIQNPLKVGSISEFVSALLKAVIAIGIPIAILFIVLAGFKFIAAQGSPDKLSEARSNFLWVVIGIAIFIGASALAELVMATLRQIGVGV